MKKYSFNFHYNKPASLQAGCPKLTVHYRNVCYIVDKISCDVPIESKNRKVQPRCVMAGKCAEFYTEKQDGKLVGIIL